jgi:putative tryptophan/tyrosine transport system substrate-binding protein
MDRRQFLLAVPGGALLVASASAQEPGRLYRIAWVTPSEATIEMMRKFRLPELARFGFVEGRNLTVTTHVGPPARIPELAREAMATIHLENLGFCGFGLRVQ